MTIGVGFLGCGPVAQAIHIPAIRALAADVAPVAFMDVNAELAEQLALQQQGTWTIDEDELIANPAVDVVVIGSPNAHHARQIIKACRAGKRAVLAEKPLAVSREELIDIRSAAVESGTRIVVGAMHAYDSAFIDAKGAWSALGESPTDIEVVAFLVSNDVMVDSATQLMRSAAPVGGPPINVPDVTAMTAGILGLASHDIPLIREFVPQTPELIAANRQRPAGYALQGVVSTCAVSIIGMLPMQWSPDWTLRVVSENAVLQVVFQPSYVLATGCRASLTVDGITRTWHSDESPYVAEWRHLRAELAGDSPLYGLDRVSADLEYALDLIAQLPTLVDGDAA